MYFTLTFTLNFHSKVALGEESHLKGKQAADMMELSYSDELANGAQLWTNQCLFSHDGQATCKYSWIGQNLYRAHVRGDPSDPKGNWNEAVDAWYSEVTSSSRDAIPNNSFLLLITHLAEFLP